MKVLVTGAHFTPAVATIEQLKKMDDVKVIYVGRNTTLEGDKTESVESKVIPEMGIKFIPIIAGRLQRSLTVFTLFSLLKIPIGFLQAFFIILRERPDVILSFGGYVAVPVVIAGWLFSIPIIIHEQTLVSGLANKISSFFADKIAVSFKKSDFNGEKVIITGNPVRSSIIEASKNSYSRHPGLPAVLVVGGNQGSHVINIAVEGCLKELTKRAFIFHQTGNSKYKDYERLSKFENASYRVFKFINEDWAKILGKCDLVISRAGINTLTEISLLGKPALIIPIPNREQNKNAKYFEDLGLIKILPQSKLLPVTLLENITAMLKNLDSLKEKAKKAERVFIPDAAKRLALETTLLGIMEPCGKNEARKVY